MQESDIRLYTKAFPKLEAFNPKPTVHFKQEFERLASTQGWSKDKRRRTEVEKIKDEIVERYLQAGSFTANQHNNNGEITLTDKQTLEIYQNMLRSTMGKQAHDNIDDCLLELKARPYVNIIDLINTWRTGEKTQAFWDWDAFVEHTMDCNTIAVNIVRDNEFLAPLLQDLGRGPSAVNPLAIRRRLLQRRRVIAENKERLARLQSAASPSPIPQALNRSVSGDSVHNHRPDMDEGPSDHDSMPGSDPFTDCPLSDRNATPSSPTTPSTPTERPDALFEQRRTNVWNYDNVSVLDLTLDDEDVPAQPIQSRLAGGKRYIDEALAKAKPSHCQYSQSLFDTELEAPAAQVMKQKVPSHSKTESNPVYEDNVHITRSATRSTTSSTRKRAASPRGVVPVKRSRTTVPSQPVNKDIRDYFKPTPVPASTPM
jgi:hypothetical protein